MKTLSQWHARNLHIYVSRLSTGALQVFSGDPDLWRLSDWVVSSAVSGPSVILCPRRKS